MGAGITEADFVGEEKASQRSSWVWEDHSSVAGAALCPFFSSLNRIFCWPEERKKSLYANLV